MIEQVAGQRRIEGLGTGTLSCLQERCSAFEIHPLDVGAARSVEPRPVRHRSADLVAQFRRAGARVVHLLVVHDELHEGRERLVEPRISALVVADEAVEPHVRHLVRDQPGLVLGRDVPELHRPGELDAGGLIGQHAHPDVGVRQRAEMVDDLLDRELDLRGPTARRRLHPASGDADVEADVVHLAGEHVQQTHGHRDVADGGCREAVGGGTSFGLLGGALEHPGAQDVVTGGCHDLERPEVERLARGHLSRDGHGRFPGPTASVLPGQQGEGRPEPCHVPGPGDTDPFVGPLAEDQGEVEFRGHLGPGGHAGRERHLEQRPGPTLRRTGRDQLRLHDLPIDQDLGDLERVAVVRRHRLVRPEAEDQLADVQIGRERDPFGPFDRGEVLRHREAQIDDRAGRGGIRPRDDRGFGFGFARAIALRRCARRHEEHQHTRHTDQTGSGEVGSGQVQTGAAPGVLTWTAPVIATSPGPCGHAAESRGPASCSITSIDVAPRAATQPTYPAPGSRSPRTGGYPARVRPGCGAPRRGPRSSPGGGR
jgi:hypothetical protein